MSATELRNITIRAAEERDLEAINAIYNFYVLTSTATFDLEPVTLDERRRWFDEHNEQYPVLVAEADGSVVGWSSLSVFRTRPAYRWTVENSVYIEDRWRGRKVGGAMLRMLLERAQQLGYHVVIARIGDSENTASRVLHAACGFELVGIEREVGFKFGRWLDVVVMQWQTPG